MSLRFSLAATLGVGSVLLLACSTPLDSYRCETTADCESTGQQGAVCEDTNLCSFSDPSCGSQGRRYGSASGTMSNECVGDGTSDPSIDASVAQPMPDGDTVSTIADAEPAPMIDAGPVAIDAATSCVDLDLTVHDDYLANDKVIVYVNDISIGECQPSPLSPGNDTMEQCQYCLPVGANIRLLGQHPARVNFFTSDCEPSCDGGVICEFVASVPCSAFVIFDTDLLPPL